jgi:hypothetical protein
LSKEVDLASNTKEKSQINTKNQIINSKSEIKSKSQINVDKSQYKQI